MVCPDFSQQDHGSTFTPSTPQVPTDMQLSALSEGSEVTVDGHKLTVSCVATSSSAPCAPPTSGVSASGERTYTGGFVAFLVLFILTIVGVVIFIVLLLLYRHRKSIRKVASEYVIACNGMF